MLDGAVPDEGVFIGYPSQVLDTKKKLTAANHVYETNGFGTILH
jgi:hypothetical protein